MRAWSPERLAKIGITIQFLALVRNLAEYFRLKHLAGRTLTLAAVEPFIIGSLVTAVCTALSVFLYFGGKFKGAIAVSGATVAMLVALKIVLSR